MFGASIHDSEMTNNEALGGSLPTLGLQLNPQLLEDLSEYAFLSSASTVKPSRRIKAQRALMIYLSVKASFSVRVLGTLCSIAVIYDNVRNSWLIFFDYLIAVLRLVKVAKHCAHHHQCRDSGHGCFVYTLYMTLHFLFTVTKDQNNRYAARMWRIDQPINQDVPKKWLWNAFYHLYLSLDSSLQGRVCLFYPKW